MGPITAVKPVRNLDQVQTASRRITSLLVRPTAIGPVSLCSFEDLVCLKASRVSGKSEGAFRGASGLVELTEFGVSRRQSREWDGLLIATECAGLRGKLQGFGAVPD